MNAWLERTTGWLFLHPWCLALLPLAVVWVVWPARRRARLPFSAQALPATWRTRHQAILPWTSGLVPLLLLVAAAEPCRAGTRDVGDAGIDLLLCLDVSSSMGTHDMAADRSRLAAAKETASSFIASRPRDRIGLVTFARFADLRCPPTRDHAALREILAGAESVPSEGKEDGTSMGTALVRVADVLRRSSAPSRVAVVLGDGLETVAMEGVAGEIAPVHGAQLLEAMGVRVHAIRLGKAAPARGAGAAEGPIGVLAARTGGLLLEAADTTQLEQMAARIDEMERAALPQFERVLEPWGLLVLGVALALGMFGCLSSAGVLRVLP